MSTKGKEHAVKFGRFLLKECFVTFNEEVFLVWEYKGKQYDTQPLYEWWVENLYD